MKNLIFTFSILGILSTQFIDANQVDKNLPQELPENKTNKNTEQSSSVYPLSAADADFLFNSEIGREDWGFSVSNAGDFNGDGYEDIILGAPIYYAEASILFGGASNEGNLDVRLIPSVVISFGGRHGFGYSVSTAGDFNGDGINDVIVGDYIDTADFGFAYIYFGCHSLLECVDTIINGVESMQPDVTFEGGSGFGCSVSTAGDVNGDNISDVIIGSRSSGNASIFFGGVAINPYRVIPDILLTAETENDQFGHSVSEAGDVNQDGFDDVIVGAPLYFQSGYKGRAYIFYGGSPMNSTADVILKGENGGDQFGNSVSYADDVNNDGTNDVIVGAYYYDKSPTEEDAGAAYVFYGSASTMDNSYDKKFTGDGESDHFGISVSNAGNMNNDGYDDVIVGSLYNISNYRGKATIFYGGPSLDTNGNIVIVGESDYDLFGRSVSSGDFNNDGFDDLIIGAPDATTTGQAYIFNNYGTLNLALAIEGFYSSYGTMSRGDDIRVELRNSSAPYNILQNTGGYLNSNFSCNIYPRFIPAGNYYINIKHRNSIETCSNTPKTYSHFNTTQHIFFLDQSKAYGNNQKLVSTSPPNEFAFYSGDVDQDGVIDGTDMSIIDIHLGETGELPSDVNGDGFVDGSDMLFVDNNSSLFVIKITPW